MGEMKTKPKTEESKPPVVYLAVMGLNYGATEDDPNGVRVEAGSEVPAEVVAKSPWLLSDGWVRFKKEAANV